MKICVDPSKYLVMHENRYAINELENLRIKLKVQINESHNFIRFRNAYKSTRRLRIF